MKFLYINTYILGLLLLLNNISFSENVQITTNGGYHPRFSPDNSKIAFTNSWNNEPNLFIVDADGSNETHIETGLSGDYHLSWHPDGTRIFFDAFQPGTYNYNIYSIPIAGGTPTKLQVSPDGNEIAPYCALDGSKVSYMKYYGGGGYAYTSVSGGAEETIFTTTMSIGWQSLSADGNVLAFCAAEGDWTDNNFDIYTVPITGGTPTKLTINSSKDVYPAWSPDGENIVFVSDRAGNGNMDLWMIPSEGGTAKQLTDFPGNEHFPHWSHDGQKIAYAGEGGIWVIDAPTYDPLCGDTDGSDEIDILDIVYLINFKYKGGPAPDPLEIGDTDGSGGIDILDIVYLINFKYKGGPEPIC